MNLDKLRLWIDALESGTYPQGRGGLVTIEDDERLYCCLGVLCELAIADGVVMTRGTLDESGVMRESFNGESGILPTRVSVWLEIDDSDPIVWRSANGEYNIIASGANDSLKWDFRRIAASLRHLYFNEPLPDDFPTDEQIIDKIRRS